MKKKEMIEFPAVTQSSSLAEEIEQTIKQSKFNKMLILISFMHIYMFIKPKKLAVECCIIHMARQLFNILEFFFFTFLF